LPKYPLTLIRCRKGSWSTWVQTPPSALSRVRSPGAAPIPPHKKRTMARSSLNDVIDPEEQTMSRRRQRDAAADEAKRMANLPKQPVRCPACSELIMVPFTRDVNEFVEAKIAKCLQSNDAKCQQALARPSVQLLVKRVKSEYFSKA
jgi:hypothetical protein